MEDLTRKRKHRQNNIQNNIQNNTQNNTRHKNTRRKVKKIKFHHHVKDYNGKSAIPRTIFVYPHNHIFPYISTNLVKGNLWSTATNLKHANENKIQSLSNAKRINEKIYLLKHKQLPFEHIKLFRNLATQTPAEFAHTKATWIASNTHRHKRV